MSSFFNSCASAAKPLTAQLTHHSTLGTRVHGFDAMPVYDYTDVHKRNLRGAYDSCVDARWVLTMDKDDKPSSLSTLLPFHSVLVRDKRIAAVVPTSIVNKAHHAKDIAIRKRTTLGPKSFLMPGLINCHCHSPMALLRGFADDLRLHEWLFDFVFPAEGELCSDVLRREYCMLGARLAAYEMLKLGTTTACEMYYGEDDITAEFLKAGLRSVMSVHAIGAGRSDEAVEKLIMKCTNFVQDVVKAGAEDYVQASYSAHSLYTLHAKYHARLHEHQKKYNRPYFMHLNETPGEDAMCRQNSYDGKSDAIQQLNEIGLINPRFTGVHAVHLSDLDIEILARNKANICHCPRSNLKLGSGVARVPELMAAGVNVCLGTDSACSNNSIDMLAEVQMAALIHKGHNQNPLSVSAYQALVMATRNGARAIGRLHELGSLEVGKLADMINVDLGFFGDRLVLDPISEVVYTTTRQVKDVFIGGRRVVEDGECLTVRLDDELIQHLDSVIYRLQNEAKLRWLQKNKENRSISNKQQSRLNSLESDLKSQTTITKSEMISPRTEATIEIDKDIIATTQLVDEVIKSQAEEEVLKTPVARSESSGSAMSDVGSNLATAASPAATIIEAEIVREEIVREEILKSEIMTTQVRATDNQSIITFTSSESLSSSAESAN